MIFATERR